MDALPPSDRALACRVLAERYQSCAKSTLVSSVLMELDTAAVTRKCGHLFSDLVEHCQADLRSGTLPRSMAQQQR